MHTPSDKLNEPTLQPIQCHNQQLHCRPDSDSLTAAAGMWRNRRDRASFTRRMWGQFVFLIYVPVCVDTNLDHFAQSKPRPLHLEHHTAVDVALLKVLRLLVSSSWEKFSHTLYQLYTSDTLLNKPDRVLVGPATTF